MQITSAGITHHPLVEYSTIKHQQWSTLCVSTAVCASAPNLMSLEYTRALKRVQSLRDRVVWNL